MGSYWRTAVHSSIAATVLSVAALAPAADRRQAWEIDPAKGPEREDAVVNDEQRVPKDAKSKDKNTAARSDYASYLPENDEILDQNGEIQFAKALLQQPPALQPGTSPAQPAARRSATGGRQSGIRLASVPNMFGDCGLTSGLATIVRQSGVTIDAGFMLPIVGGSRTGKIAENDVALPVDRIFFNYNHYQNIFTMVEEQVFPPGNGPLFRDEPIDRYTFGLEKTFLDGTASVEVRMPFNGSFDADLPNVGVSNGSVGNIAVLLKTLLFQTDNLGIGGGLAIEAPTGSDTVARLGADNLLFVNESLHVLPYVGFLYSPGDPAYGWGDGLFMSGFLQVDVTGSGSTIRFIDPTTGASRGDLGIYNEQHVIYVDMAMGYWLYRDPDADNLTGLAMVSEVHYTTSLQDPDLVAGATQDTGAVVTNTSGRFDVVNATIACQALLREWSSLRVGAVLPIGRDDDERFFDAELQVQFNRRY
jgi:hypothetical protein